MFSFDGQKRTRKPPAISTRWTHEKGATRPFQPQRGWAPYKKASRFAQTGCGAQRPLRALSGTRVLLTAAPTAPPCTFFALLRFEGPSAAAAAAPRRGAGCPLRLLPLVAATSPKGRGKKHSHYALGSLSKEKQEACPPRSWLSLRESWQTRRV